MVNRRSFFQKIWQFAAILALAPQLAFKAPKLSMEVPLLYPWQEAMVNFFGDSFAPKVALWGLKSDAHKEAILAAMTEPERNGFLREVRRVFDWDAAHRTKVEGGTRGQRGDFRHG